MALSKSPEECFVEIRNEIEAVSEIAPINLPEDAAIQEGYRVAALVEKYGTRLAKSDIDQKYLETMGTRAGAYAYAVAQLEAFVKVSDNNKVKFDQNKAEAFEVRRYALSTVEYVFRKDRKVLATLADNIKPGRGVMDLTKDLLSIHKLAKDQKKRLEEACADFSLFEQAHGLHCSLSDLMSQIDIDPDRINAAKETCLKAWTYLWEALDEINAAGRFVFMNEPDVEELFYIDYLQKSGRRKTGTEASQEPEPQPASFR